MRKDIIYRQDAIDALRTCKAYFLDMHDPDKKICLASAEYEIEKLPSAQPEHTMRCKYCDMSICTLEDKPCSGKVMMKE